MFSDDYAPGCYWMRDAPLPAAPVEPLPASADVVVIGSGYTGLAAARETALAGRSTLVLEAGEIGADGAAMVQIDQDLQTLTDDLLRFSALDVGHKANAARIVLVPRIVETLSFRQVHHGQVHRGRSPFSAIRDFPANGRLDSISAFMPASPGWASMPGRSG